MSGVDFELTPIYSSSHNTSGCKTINSCTYLCLKSLFLQQGMEGAGKRGRESEPSHLENVKGYFDLISGLLCFFFVLLLTKAMQHWNLEESTLQRIEQKQQKKKPKQTQQFLICFYLRDKKEETTIWNSGSQSILLKTREKVRQWRRVWGRVEEWVWGPRSTNKYSHLHKRTLLYRHCFAQLRSSYWNIDSATCFIGR